MKRWLISKLQEWKDKPRRKPLLLLGARQVGKTWLMKEFGRLAYKKTAYVRFDKEPRMREAFEQDYDIKRLLTSIQLHSGTAITPEDTLIILDEIQECPSALTSLKYFCEEAREYSIIAAGSLLGLAEHTGTGFPVGKADRLMMYPMSFTEFLHASGHADYVELIRQRDWGMMKTFQDKLAELLRYYYYVGGMPEAVSAYAEEGDFQQVREIQSALLEDYRADFRKHSSESEAIRIAMVWDSIPEQLAREDKRFVLASVQKGLRAAQVRPPIQWLKDAGLVNVVQRVSRPELPLGGFSDAVFKLYFLDVGLLSAKCGLPADVLLGKNDIFRQYKGALTEQYVLQQLLSECDIMPYYWAAERSHAEVDFLFSNGRAVIPIEVKAELNLQSKSLKSFHRRYCNPLAVRTSMAPYAVNTINLPASNGVPAGSYRALDIPLFAISQLTAECEVLCQG